MRITKYRTHGLYRFYKDTLFGRRLWYQVMDVPCIRLYFIKSIYDPIYEYKTIELTSENLDFFNTLYLRQNFTAVLKPNAIDNLYNPHTICTYRYGQLYAD